MSSEKSPLQIIRDIYQEHGLRGLGMLVLCLPLFLLIREFEKQNWIIPDEEKQNIEAAKERSSNIDHWSELIDNRDK